MTWEESAAIVVHPARDRLMIQAREDNADLGQRDAARATLIRMTAHGHPSPADEQLRAYVAKHGGCCG